MRSYKSKHCVFYSEWDGKQLAEAYIICLMFFRLSLSFVLRIICRRTKPKAKKKKKKKRKKKNQLRDYSHNLARGDGGSDQSGCNGRGWMFFISKQSLLWINCRTVNMSMQSETMHLSNQKEKLQLSWQTLEIFLKTLKTLHCQL